MIPPDLNTTADFVVASLIHYSFDRGGYTAGELVDRWFEDYPVNWVRLAMIEALYQGRYKAISVEQILSFWSRRGQAVYHFNQEFERLICGNFFQTLSGRLDTTPPASDLEKTGGNHQVSNKDKMSIPKSEHMLPSNSTSHPAIEQFTPEKINGSDFYIKLKAIAQQPKD